MLGNLNKNLTQMKFFLPNEILLQEVHKKVIAWAVGQVALSNQ